MIDNWYYRIVNCLKVNSHNTEIDCFIHIVTVLMQSF